MSSIEGGRPARPATHRVAGRAGRPPSMEPRLVSRGNLLVEVKPVSLFPPSMEPRLVSRGNHRLMEQIRHAIDPSMEPRLVSRGNSARAAYSRRSLRLQWSRGS